MELISSPKKYLDADKKPPAAKPVSTPKDASIHECKLVIAFDSGERYKESFVLKATSPELALTILGSIAQARLAVLLNLPLLSE
jgi:hypothetical protein